MFSMVNGETFNMAINWFELIFVIASSAEPKCFTNSWHYCNLNQNYLILNVKAHSLTPPAQLLAAQTGRVGANSPCLLRSSPKTFFISSLHRCLFGPTN